MQDIANNISLNMIGCHFAYDMIDRPDTLTSYSSYDPTIYRDSVKVFKDSNNNNFT